VAHALVDPHDLLDGDALPADPSLIRHAVIVSDALEAVTNGMTNPDAWEALAALPSSSPLAPWKQLVLALDRVYQRDADGFYRESHEIPRDTPPACILPFLEALLQENASVAFETPAEERLAAALVTEDTVVPSAVEELQAARELEEYGLFADTVALLARHVYAAAPDMAASLMLWAFRQILDAEADTAGLRGYCRGIFGPVESLRLVALATIRDEPEISLLYWVRYAREGLVRKRLTDEQRDAALAIACDLAEEVEADCSDDPEDRLYHDALASDVRQLSHVLAEPRPEDGAGALASRSPYALLRSIARRPGGDEAPKKRKKPRRRRKPRAETGQLELFPPPTYDGMQESA
jgi:hypothetical protein